MYDFVLHSQKLIENALSDTLTLIQVRFIELSIIFQRKYPILFMFIMVVYTPIWFLLMIVRRVYNYIQKKIGILYHLSLKLRYKNDAILNRISEREIELKPEDIRENNEILQDVVENIIVDYMKIVNGDFEDLFQEIMYGGSFYKDLKVDKPNEYDLCLTIDLTRSISSKLIKIEPDKNNASFVKVKINDNQFPENENFWHKLLGEQNYLNQNHFREWIHATLTKALEAASGGLHRGGYTVKQHRNVYCINFRPKGPALTLTVIRKNLWRKIEVDLVPCLVFKNQYLPGFRPREAKKWIALAKPLPNDVIEGKEFLWRAGFQEDEKKLLADPIKPIIKLVKKLRDVQGWVHLKSYFIETLFMHELDDQAFRFFYTKCSKKTLFMYILKQLQNKLARGELLYYWHKKFNLLDERNSLLLLETSKELREIINEIECEVEKNEDQYFFKMFHPNVNIEPPSDFFYVTIFLICCCLLLCKMHGKSTFDLYIHRIVSAFLNDQIYCISNSTIHL